MEEKTKQTKKPTAKKVEPTTKKSRKKTDDAKSKNKRNVDKSKKATVVKPKVEKLTKSADNKATTKKTNISTQKSTKAKKKDSPKIKGSPTNIKIWGYNQLKLNVNLYENVEKPKAVVIVAHGMMEHSGRYDAFAKFLNKNNFVVITSDLRGHGLTAISKERLGFGDKDIFQETLIDLQGLVYFAKERYALPVYLFGHSYGSLLSQRLIQVCPDIEKCVLCGTANGSSAIMKLGGMVCSILSPFKNKDSAGGMIEKMCIKSYGKKFNNGNWLSRDEKVFEEYQKDVLCGGSFPFSFYKSMIKNCNKNNKEIHKIGRKKLFLIAGSADPISNGAKQVEKLHKIYLERNIDSKLKIYKDARHELLNEINKVEVWQDVIKFYNS